MSYEAKANLFYGVWTSEADLRAGMDLPAKGKHWEKIEEACSDADLNILVVGNGLTGYAEIGLAIVNFEVNEGMMAIPDSKMIVSAASRERLQKFLDMYKIKELIGWHLGSSYG